MVGEADSSTWHGSRAALHRDCRRYDELVRVALRVLRVSWEQAVFEEERLGALLTDVAHQQRTGQEVSTRRRPARTAP